MKFDHLVIGSGMAGMICALRLLESGKSVAVVGTGRSALHFSSGSLDLLARLPSGEHISEPLSAIERFAEQFPRHPYGRMPQPLIREALAYTQQTLAQRGLTFSGSAGQCNHYRITALGTLRATWLSPQTTYAWDLAAPESGLKQVALVTLAGSRDYQPVLAAANMAQNPYFSGISLKPVELQLPGLAHFSRNACELRSAELGNKFNKPELFEDLCIELKSRVGDVDLVLLPAMLQSPEQLRQLESRTGLRIREVSSMPPSQPGMRIEQALLDEFVARGGTLLKGDKVLRGEFSGDRLTAVYTENFDSQPLKADSFVLASGSFFSHGLTSQREGIREPVFGLDVDAPAARCDWYQQQFIPEQPHAYMSSGVRVDDQFRPGIDGQTVSNLYCAGAVLAHFNPVYEGSGSGVAISSGYFVAEQMLSDLSQSAVGEEQL